MGDMADYTREQFEWWEWEEGDDHSAECKYCGIAGLYWSIEPNNGGLRLFDENGVLHACKEYQKKVTP